MLAPQEFFDLTDFEHRGLFSGEEPVWTALDRLKGYLEALFRDPWPLSGKAGQIDRTLVIYEGEAWDDFQVRATGPKGALQAYREGEILEGAAMILPGAFLANDRVILGPGTVVEPGAFIRGPAVIGGGCEIRQGAYVRGDCLIGNGCVVGHTTEMKGSILLDRAKAAHFAYVGDSILGRDVNLGAGTKLANLKMIPGSVVVTVDRKRHDTGRRKLGAVLGDRTETGCNSVTSPGTLLGPDSVVYAGVAVPPGGYPSRTIIRPSPDSLQIRSIRR
jgi:carbonic anhydrase/acetyltransferase-like protein (isoleucine patch superfamily)